jgi:valyl-tRNA synthetase
MDQYIKKFLNPENLIIGEKLDIPEKCVSIILATAQVYIPLGSLVDVEQEITKLKDQLDSLANEITRCEKMLNNPGFTNKAPAQKIEAEQQKLQMYQENYREVQKRLKELTN